MHTFITFPDDSPSFLNHNKSRRHLQKFGQDVTHIKTSFGVQMNTNAVERIHADVERRILLARRYTVMRRLIHTHFQAHATCTLSIPFSKSPVSSRLLKKAKNKEDDGREGTVPQHSGYSLARMHGEREAAYFRDIGAEMEGSVTVLPCSQTWQGFLQVNKFQDGIQGYKKRVDELKIEFLHRKKDQWILDLGIPAWIDRKDSM
ncbi:hypothetical protein EDD85DRAFT_942357 [Armillaria nabsnona]|nr:hypothetical protein EDD85DRAFT_942357 [Armillaria nabsnona]